MLLHKTVNIPNLEKIQREVLAVVEDCFTGISEEQKGTKFAPLDTKKFMSLCPTLTEYVSSIGLLDRWAKSALVRLYPLAGGYNVLYPHVDNPDNLERIWSLNIPIADCEQSYTIFYSTTKETWNSKTENSSHLDFVKKIDFTYDEVTEIDRVQCDKPYWCRTSIAHGAINYGDRTRKLLVLRFIPEVFELLGH